jgi:hypothetical protein
VNAPTFCPHCGRENDTHSATIAALVPKVGDVSICWGCAATGIFDQGPAGLLVRLPTPDESAEIEASPELVAVIERHRAAVGRELTPTDAIRSMKAGG